MTVLRS